MAGSGYSPKQRMAYESCECDRPVPFSLLAPLLDKEADRKLSGGFNTRKSNLCETCHEYKSVNGTCGC